MTPRQRLYRLAFAPLVRGAAKTAILGRNRVRGDMSKGRFTIKVFGGGELVPPLGVFDAVSAGTVQMGNGAAYYWSGKAPAAAFFTNVPFGMNAQQTNAWLEQGGGLDLWRERYAPHRLVPFPVGNTGVQMGGWFRKPLNGVDEADAGAEAFHAENPSLAD